MPSTTRGKLGCTHLIDAATLTGAIEVALANVHVGAFGTPREYLDRFLESAKAAGEKMWPMPMDEEYEEMIKSNIADIRNTGSGKGGGASTGAWFIKEFVGRHAVDSSRYRIDMLGGRRPPVARQRPHRHRDPLDRRFRAEAIAAICRFFSAPTHILFIYSSGAYTGLKSQKKPDLAP